MTQPTNPQPTDAALRSAQMYESYMVPLMFAPWVPVLLDFAEIREGEHVLDLACGTGSVARQAAQRVGAGGAVSALDLNPAMLQVARGSAAPDAPSIDWQQGSAQDSCRSRTRPLRRRCVSRGCSFFRTPLGALREMRRVLEVGGRAALLINQEMEHNPLYQRLSQAGQARAGVDLFAAAFALSNPEELEALMLAAGFVDVELKSQSRTVRYPDPERFISSIVQGAAAALPALAALSGEPRQQLIDQLRGDLADWLAAQTEDGVLVTQMAVYLARGRRPD